MSSEFNPNISVTSPFPRLDLPTLHVWAQRLRSVVADDSVPTDLDEWMDWQMRRETNPDMQTWAAYKFGELGGYVEAIHSSDDGTVGITPALMNVAQVTFVFKKDVLWGERNRVTPLNHVLREVFASAAIAYFPVYKHNRSIQELLKDIGAVNIGAVAPRLQGGNPVESQMWAVTRDEWRHVNDGFLLAVEASEQAATAVPAQEVA